MSDQGVYANFEPFEGTVNSETTIDFNRKSRKLLLVNDHASNDLSYKFNDSESFGTLKGTESLSMTFTAKKVIIDGTGVPYRIYVFG